MITENQKLGELKVKKETKNSKTQEEAEVKAAKAETPASEPAVAPEAKPAPVKSAADDKEGKVGLLLKEVRLKKGKELPEIAQELCIRRVYLAAIEDSDYNNIPEYPYGIGFIRSYADYLGLDGAKIVQMYKDEAEADLRKNNPYFVIEPQVEATVPSKKYLMISLIAVFAIYFAWTMYNRMSESSDEEPAIEETLAVENDGTDDSAADFPLKVEDFSTTTESSDAAPEALPVVDAADAEDNNPQVTVKEESFVPAGTAPKTENPAPVETSAPVKAEKEDQGLVIKVKKETWIEVKNAQKLYISKVLQAGDSYKLPDDKDLKLSVGRADGVDVTLNGKTVYNVSPSKKMNLSVDEILAQAKH